MLQSKQDAYGHLIWDYFTEGTGYQIVEREDGFISPPEGPGIYFKKFARWSLCEKHLIRRVHGRTLDVGCGAGRVALYLQEKGLDVVAIDNSHLAIKVCRGRGVKRTKVRSLFQLTPRDGVFDSIVMFGNTLCLIGSPRKAPGGLKRLARITAENGIIVAQMRDPHQTDLREHLEYHRLMRQKGRMAGQSRIRIRYKRFVTPWMEFLMLSRPELRRLVKGTGWEVSQFVDGEGGQYGVVLKRRPRATLT